VSIDVMSMGPSEARRRYLEYRSSVREHRESRLRNSDGRSRRSQVEREEDELRAAYREMALGNRVVCLPHVIRAAGFNDKGLPLLAVSRSNWEWCHYGSRSEAISFRPDRFNDKKRIELVMQLPEGAGYKSARALVPPVPPRFRPADLGNYYTLWEAEWLPEPPRDPLLLKQVSTTMFVVVAQWDLTDIERAVLEGRFAQ
jgi:hypothetical protein